MMKNKIVLISSIISATILGLTIAYVFVTLVESLAGAKDNVRKVDCGMAEFHPDYTPEMKAACRERRMRRL